MSKDNPPILVAELGATNSRLAILSSRQSLTKQANYLTSKFKSVETLFTEYIKETGIQTKRAVIGVAAPILGDLVQFVNLDLKFSQKELEKNIFSDKLVVLNDLELQAHAVESFKEKDVFPIGELKEKLHGNKILVSPGTGLGLAGIVNGIVTPTEAGHLNIPVNLYEFSSIIEKFKLENKRMPTFEDLLSGKGINYIYCFLTNLKKSSFTNREILLNTKDPNCLKTKELLLYLLAVFLRNMVLVWGSSGGAYVSGSMINTLLLDLNEKEFRKNFENSPKMKEFLSKTPLFVVLTKNLGLRGALNLVLNS